MGKNVIDYYSEWETEAIKADLDTRRSPLVTVCMNLTSDFNKGSVIRANNAFLGRKVYLIGRRKYDRRGTVGTYHYEHVDHSPEFADIAASLIEEGYTLYPVDNIEAYDPQPLDETVFPEKTALIFGEEREGLSEETIRLCNGPMVYIRQFGSVRSLNISQAASTAMYEYTRQHPGKGITT